MSLSCYLLRSMSLVKFRKYPCCMSLSFCKPFCLLSLSCCMSNFEDGHVPLSILWIEGQERGKINIEIRPPLAWIPSGAPCPCGYVYYYNSWAEGSIMQMSLHWCCWLPAAVGFSVLGVWDVLLVSSLPVPLSLSTPLSGPGGGLRSVIL